MHVCNVERSFEAELFWLLQVRGKKNLVIGQDLAGPVGLFVKFSLLQEYGVDRVFLLENANVDSTQRNVVFLVHGENVNHVRTVAGMWSPFFLLLKLHFLFRSPIALLKKKERGCIRDNSRLRRLVSYST